MKILKIIVFPLVFVAILAYKAGWQSVIASYAEAKKILFS